MSRCGLLRACGASLIAIAHILCTRLQHVRGPIGSISNKLFSFSPNLPSSKNLHRLPPPPRRGQWLSILLTFADECIFKSERIAEAAFPRSARLFDSIHGLADGLPAAFEDALDRFPFQDLLGVSSKIGWLNLVVSAALSHYWGGGSSRSMKEKEISVDMGWCIKKKKKKRKCDDNEDEEDEEDASFPALQCTKRAKQPQGRKESLQAHEADNTEEDVSGGGRGTTTKCTYKDVLTKGVVVKDDEEEEEEEEQEGAEELLDHFEMKKKRFDHTEEECFSEGDNNNGGGDFVSGEKRVKNGKGKGKGEKDQILQLFDSSWSLC
ncbi:unnamed protein product [Cuscuta campestris]|uniref:Uncharacterized protein n=1 Tax=Cuscuta campestris TaxID=132261 RepID=A0A484KX00_9ASTE|nr:unnamed protein product [Cuscuta campestris]